MAILDANGRPYPVAPRRPIDIAGAARIQNPGQRWAQALGPISPERLFCWLRDAARGDTEAYLSLAVEMEEKYLHYAAQLQTRKLALTGEEVEVLPGDDTPLAQEIADMFNERVVDSECFSDMLFDLLDAFSKGYSVVQAHWDTSRALWVPREYEHLDARYFTFDRETLTELRLRDEMGGNPDGQKLPKGLIVHRPKLRTGVTCRAGLARPAAVAYLFQTATVSQWMVFAETFGMPLRLGEYDPNTSSEDEISQLRTAIVNIGHNAAAILPTGMKISFPDARRPTSGDNVFKEITDYWDGLISKLVLGQSQTSDHGSVTVGGDQAGQANQVRLDLRRADARSLCATLRRDLVTPWTLWNYGEGAPVPELQIAVDPPEDLKMLSDALTPLISAGLRVRAQDIRDKFGLESPLATDEIISPPAPPVDPNKEAALTAAAKAPAPKPSQRMRGRGTRSRSRG